jgi:pimeloyl-ACP methyl ester carboxylesterase
LRSAPTVGQSPNAIAFYTKLVAYLHTRPHRETAAARARGVGAYQIDGALTDADLFRRLRVRGQAPGTGRLAAGVAATPAGQQRTHDTYDVLDKITTPTLVLHGTGDELGPVENADFLADRIPNGRAVRFPEAGTPPSRNAAPQPAKR